jgi:DNA-binding SARP family transcriptional activator
VSDIKYAYPLILNKVASPQYATPVLRRARLLDWLNEAANCRATVIAADAGYGKTTLLWQWEREVEFPCYWYKLDRTDRDWTFHISYLIETISKRHRGFGRRAHSMLQQMSGPGTARPGVTAYLLAEMHQRLTEPCTFIIDDWQYVNAVTEVRGLWNQILRDAPATCRFVFASRVKPKLQFARFKTHSGYAELQTDALRFTEPEIAELFRDIYNDPLDAAELAELEARTEGWAASLQLVEVSLRERTTAAERRQFIRSITATRDSDLFDFLAEEVLDQQPAETRDFLLSTSILHQITPEVAERLTGANDGPRVLRELTQRGLFTQQLDSERFRFHHLFREFLERRLTYERSEAEVTGLHIHAASYFETTAQWPESIHHYLKARLQRQAARLIARHGEALIEEGRLGLVDEWLEQLPPEVKSGNARLSLISGEAYGMRGEWDDAKDSLQRAHDFFVRRGDQRLAALACAKLSSLFSNYGDPMEAARWAAAGQRIVPDDAVAIRIRLEGNIATTKALLTEPLDDVVDECRRIALECGRHGLEHFGAIAHHNAGEVLLRMGRFHEAVVSLEAAAKFWADPPTSPFADNSELVVALMSVGKISRAREMAREGLLRTEPWKRPHAYALVGQSYVHIADSRFGDAIACLEEAARFSPLVGPALRGGIDAALVEAFYLQGGSSAEISVVHQRLSARVDDPRQDAEVIAARAIATHVSTECAGECLAGTAGLAEAKSRGATATALVGEVKVGLLRIEHKRRAGARRAWDCVAEALDRGLAPRLRPWIRLYAVAATSAINVPGGFDCLARLIDLDPEGWRRALIDVLPAAKGSDRVAMLAAISRNADRQTITALQAIDGRDVAEARRALEHTTAARLYLRTFGGIGLHRGSWSGPALAIEKRRVRMLLAVMAARTDSTLTRDMAIDILWPDSDPDAAINSLNQTVFQLRRYIDPTYRGGQRPEYVISSSEQVALNPDLVRTDLDEIRRLDRISGADWTSRRAIAKRAISLIRGEFLADLRYEDWTAMQQVAVHNEVRERLLPIATDDERAYDAELSALAASALIILDPFDERAILALADSFSRSGRRVAARDIIIDYARRLQSELDESPSDDLITAAQAFGAEARVKKELTEAQPSLH